MQLGPCLHVFSLARILFPQPSYCFHGVKICIWRNLTFLYKRLIFLCPEQPQFGGYLGVQLLYSNFLVKNYILNTYFSHPLLYPTIYSKCSIYGKKLSRSMQLQVQIQILSHSSYMTLSIKTLTKIHFLLKL